MVAIIALHGVRCAAPQLGHRVVVLGLGLLGQLAVQELAAAGAEVFGIDLDPAKVALARELGASAGCTAGDDAALRVLEFTGGAGADAVVITAATKDDSAVRLAAECAAKGARIVLVGTADIQLDRQIFWEKELRFLVSRASGPGALDAAYELKGQDYPAEYVRWTEGRNLEAFLELVRRRRVDVGRLTTHRFPIERAMEAFALVEGGGQPFIGVVLTYPAAPARARTLVVQTTSPSPPSKAAAPSGKSGDLGVALVGAGLFARAQLLPALKKVRGLRTVTLAATSGVNASHFAKKYGFQKATTEWRDVLHDAEVDAVFVLTRHDAHAAMVEEALAAGKHVFVEKPLCMTEEELQRIAKAHAKAQAEFGTRHLLVGYNRRFSPLLAECKQFLGERRAPATVLLRINAGAVPADHWAHQAAEGGGRILSEACHFFDLAMAITGEGCSRVYARAATSSGGLNLGDEAAVLLTMDRGSIVQIVYTGAGDRSFSRERVEVFSGGAVVAIDDWRKAELCRNNHRKTVSRFNADLGYEAELDAFLGGIARGVPAVPFDVLAGSTLATLRALQSLGTGAAEPCAWEPIP
jgi:predicted dehydrogenase